MRRVVYLAFLVIFSCLVISAQEPKVVIVSDRMIIRGAFFSYIDGKTYVSPINPERLKQTPSWKLNKGKPPLSAKKAIKIATRRFSEFTNSENWDFKEILLRRAADDKWFYVIRFSENRFKANPPETFVIPKFTGGVKRFSLIVLMDGTTIKPELLQEERLSEPEPN